MACQTQVIRTVVAEEITLMFFAKILDIFEPDFSARSHTRHTYINANEKSDDFAVQYIIIIVYLYIIAKSEGVMLFGRGNEINITVQYMCPKTLFPHSYKIH